MDAFPRRSLSLVLRVFLVPVSLVLLAGNGRGAVLHDAPESGRPGADGTVAEPSAHLQDKRAISANGITLGGPIQWSLSGGSLVLQAASLCNDGSVYNPTGTLRVELWASSQPFTGSGSFTGYKLAESGGLTGLNASQCYNNYSSGSVPLLTVPPDGVYYVVMFLDMFTSSSVDDGYSYVDFGQFPNTITVQGGVISNTTGGCTPNSTTLCIDDSAGDRRFKIQATFHTSQGGGSAGNGGAIQLSGLGVNAGGLFWFFSANNPELLIKVLNGCGVNSRHWVFASAGTNVGATVSVIDTRTGAQKTYTNPDLNPFPTIQDTAAFPCPNGSN